MKWLLLVPLIIMGLVFVLLIIPIGISFDASNASVVLCVKAFGFKYQLYPKRPKKQKEDKSEPEDEPIIDEYTFETDEQPETPKPSEKSGTKSESKPPKEEGKTSFVKDFVSTLNFEKVMEYLTLVSVAFDGVARCLYIPRFSLTATLHSDDPAMTAMMYGGAYSAIGVIYPKLERIFRIKKGFVEFYPGFDAETSFDLKITVMAMPIKVLILAVKLYFKWKKIEKESKAVQA